MMQDLEAGTVLAYPTQREAAAFLGISESTLSRSHLTGIRAGGRGLRYRPADVLGEAMKHKRRSLNEIAADLLAYARENAPSRADEVRAEIETFFERRPRPVLDSERFLAEAERTLPRRLYEQVKQAYEYDGEGEPLQLVGEPVTAE